MLRNFSVISENIDTVQFAMYRSESLLMLAVIYTLAKDSHLGM